MKRFQTESNQKHKLMEMREKIWFSIVKMSKITIILIRNAENLSLSSVWLSWVSLDLNHYSFLSTGNAI